MTTGLLVGCGGGENQKGAHAERQKTGDKIKKGI